MGHIGKEHMGHGAHWHMGNGIHMYKLLTMMDTGW